MPGNKYIRISIDGQPVELSDPAQLPISINYEREDGEDFQVKKPSSSFDVTVPATRQNDQLANTFHNPAVDDLTSDERFRNPRPAVIESNGYELLVGKAFLISASHDRRPLAYKYNFYGDNADWAIDLEETTLFDCLQHINFTFSKQHIIDSWAFDGRDELMPYIFAPVRYGEPMGSAYANLVQNPPPVIEDYNMLPEYMRPSLSPYWILRWGFASIGYRIQSAFFDTDYFRRATMPWTWGNFLYSEGTRLNNLDFLAKSSSAVYFSGTTTQIWDLLVNNDNANGAFDNNGVYEYDIVNKEMKWTYLNSLDYGLLDATFHLAISVDATAVANSDVELRIQYYKNGVRVTTGNPGENANGDEIVNLSAPTVGRNDKIGVVDLYQNFRVKAGDVISAKFYLHTYDSDFGRANISAQVMAFEIDYFKIPIGGTIDFKNFTSFKQYKLLDLLRGLVDTFNLSIATDPANKVVLIEPTHPYALGSDLSIKNTGFMNGDFIDWSDKQDLSKSSEMNLFSDYNRELIFQFKDDNADGLYKVVQDRYNSKPAAGKYVFPSRFKTGKKEVTNRFFSPVMHYEVEQWKGIGSDEDASPQMICLVPENISNTSSSEAQNTFAPKLAWYKGIVTDVGWVFDGEKKNSYPYMFAVNYKPGGEEDPIFSYSDEQIGNPPYASIGVGLLRRFFLQRLAIMRNGQYYTTFFRLNNYDVSNRFHREHIVCRGQRWELTSIKNFRPLVEESTECDLKRWVPVAPVDSENVFPAEDTVLEAGTNSNAFDLKYTALKCLPSDIPKPE